MRCSLIQRAFATTAILTLSTVLVAAPASAATFNSTGVTFTAADTAGLNLGSDANFAFIDLGSGTTLGWNSGPENGNALVGNGVTVNTSGGNNGGLNGHTLFFDSATICNPSPCGSGLQNPPATQLVSTSTTSTALSIAQNVSNFANGLTPTLTPGALTGTVTINGTSGLNVISLPSFNNVTLVLNGPADAFFVFNISGLLNTNLTMTLTGGVVAANVLWNLTGTTGHVLQTSGGDSLVGTFLATDGGQFQFSNLELNGELINTGGDVQLVSGSEIQTPTGFSVPSTPLPAALPLFATGLGALGLLGWRRKRGAQAVA